MPTTRARSARRAAAKRTILAALDENTVSNDATIPTLSKVTIVNKDIEDDATEGSVVSNLPCRPFRIPNDFDGTNTESINILLEDIEKEVKSRQESVAIKYCEAIKRQHEAYFRNAMKIEKSVKKMKIKDFNQKYMNKISGDGEVDPVNNDIIALMKSLMNDDAENNGSNNSALGKKRVRNFGPGFSNLDLETPSRPTGRNMKTPGTILRTAKKGEMLMSANGSPIEQCEDGALVATVLKKRRANGLPEAAMFDINVGGRMISLCDPNSMTDLTSEMKNTVSAQLNILQDQLSKILSQIEG